MAKERTWIDYANLGSNIAQNFQLHHANQTLEELQRAATASALSEQQKRQVDEHEAQLREYVFQIGEDIEGLQRHLHELPCAALALALRFKGMLEKNNVTTASFRAWEDKNRMKQVVKGLDDVCEKSAARLTEGQREDAEKCAKYLAEGDAFDQLVSIQREKKKFQKEREQLEKNCGLAGKREELAKLKSEQSRIQFPAWARACFTVGGLGLAFSMLWFIVFSLSTVSLDSGDDTVPQGQLTTPLSIPGGVTFVVFLISFVVTSIPLFTPARMRHAELTKRIKALVSEIATAKAELNRFDSQSPILPKPLEAMRGIERDLRKEIEEIERAKTGLPPKYVSQDRLEELYAMFGDDLPSEAYEQMKQERETLIKMVLGKSDATSIAS